MKNKIITVIFGLFLIGLVSATNSTDFQNIDEDICIRTYEHLLEYGNEDYNIGLLVDRLSELGIQQSEENLKYWYIDGFDRYCSESILRTSQPKLVCDKIYWLVTNDGWDYNNYEITKIKNDLKEDTLISERVILEYSINYNKLCNEEGVDGRPLPNQPTETNLRNKYVVVIGLVVVLLLWSILKNKPTVYKNE